MSTWVFVVEDVLTLVISLVLLTLHLWAVVDSFLHRPGAYEALTRFTKVQVVGGLAVCAFLAVAATLVRVEPFNILWLITTYVVGCYLAGMRPRLSNAV